MRRRRSPPRGRQRVRVRHRQMPTTTLTVPNSMTGIRNHPVKSGPPLHLRARRTQNTANIAGQSASSQCSPRLAPPAPPFRGCSFRGERNTQNDIAGTSSCLFANQSDRTYPLGASSLVRVASRGLPPASLTSTEEPSYRLMDSSERRRPTSIVKPHLATAGCQEAAVDPNLATPAFTPRAGRRLRTGAFTERALIGATQSKRRPA